MAVLWDIGWRVRILGLILLGLGAVLYIDAQVSCSHVDLSALCVAVNPETPIGLMLIASGIVTMSLGFVARHIMGALLELIEGTESEQLTASKRLKQDSEGEQLTARKQLKRDSQEQQ